MERHLPEIVPVLLKRFSSREGYRLYDDAMPICRCLSSFLYGVQLVTSIDPAVKKLQELGVKTALVSNTDSRICKHRIGIQKE